MCVELVPELIDWSAIFIAFYEVNGGRGKVRTCDPCRVKAERSGINPQKPFNNQASTPRKVS